MLDPQTRLERSIMRIVDALDRESPLGLSVQLQGALKFGVALGDLPVGGRMPSVRDLARRAGVSPVTVQQVYSALQQGDMLESRPGRGTYVRGNIRLAEADGLRAIDRQLAALLRDGQDHGLSPGDLAARISAMGQAPRRALHLLMLGNFRVTTESYAADLRPMLGRDDRITVRTLAELALRPAPEDIDLVLAPVTLLREAEHLFPRRDRLGLTLIPGAQTRIALAAIQPGARVVGLSWFADFIPSMRAGIQRFAPHVADLVMLAHGAPDMAAQLARAEVIVWSSGNDGSLTDLRPDQTAFEYRHTPDGAMVRDTLLPVLDALRAGTVPDHEEATR